MFNSLNKYALYLLAAILLVVFFTADGDHVTPYLRQIGVRKEDIIISLPDASGNITLVAYGNKGYSKSDGDVIDIGDFKRLGAKYLVINNKEWLDRPEIKPYAHRLIGNFKDQIFVVDIRQPL